MSTVLQHIFDYFASTKDKINEKVSTCPECKKHVSDQIDKNDVCDACKSDVYFAGYLLLCLMK